MGIFPKMSGVSLQSS